MSYQVLVADYGMNVWDGGLFDLGHRLKALRAIGYHGLERLSAVTEAGAVEAAAKFRRLGMMFATVSAPTPELSIRWSAAFGCRYVWTSVAGQDFDTFCRQVNVQAEACERWGLRVALHNHMGSLVEKHEEVVAFLERCPKAGLILDTAHLAAVGGDPIAIVRRYPERLTQLHLKDWLAEREADAWHQRGRFCELGAGNIGLDNAAVVQALIEVGYAGTLCVEHDTHLQDPIEDLKISRQYLADCGV
jgi:sugar phosphate isomerase/epimerase